MGAWISMSVGVDRYGYPRVALYRNRKPHTFTVHTLVAKAFLGPARGRQVNHKDGNKLNNRVRNLEWVSAKANVRHRFNVLGHVGPRGERQGHHKLTAVDVQNIKDVHASGATQAALAAAYKVNPSTISRITSGKRWNYTKDTP
jgi:hypothetical protein